MTDLVLSSPNRPTQVSPMRRAWDRLTPMALLLAMIVATLAGQLWFVFNRQMNPDEFYFLARIHEYARGDLQDALQTFHVHLFQAVLMVPGDEVDQIVVARVMMLAFEVGTLAMMFMIGRRFASQAAALFGVAAYVASTNVFIHGASFRFDPVATFLLMSGLAALLVPAPLRLRHAVAAGVLVALAGLVTIKSVFYLPLIVVAALWRLAGREHRLATFGALAGGGAASVLAFATFHLLHAATLEDLTSAPESGAFLSHSMSTMLNFGEMAMKMPFLLGSIVQNVVLWAGIAAGIAVCLARLALARGGSPLHWLLLACATPLLTLLFYRNSFPYYYVFALAPAAVLVAVAIDALRFSETVVKLVALMMGILAFQHAATFYVDQDPQRETLRAVHEVFPQPVPYIDQYSMVGSFPKVGFFMSTWGVETYLVSRSPSFPELLLEQQPAFVLANSFVLRNAMEGEEFPGAYQLLSRDIAALRSGYIHHWGPIWVAGKTFERATPTPQDFDIMVAADYTLEASGEVTIDGRRLAPGAVLHLSQGGHRLQAVDGAFPVVLRWGDHLAVPASPASERPVFNGFR